MFLLKQSVYSLRIFSPSKLKCIPAALVVYRELFKFYFNYCLWIAGCVIAVLIVNYISIPYLPITCLPLFCICVSSLLLNEGCRAD